MSIVITNQEPDEDIVAEEAARIAELPALLHEEKLLQEEIDNHPYRELSKDEVFAKHDAGDKEASRLIALARTLSYVSDAIDCRYHEAAEARQDVSGVEVKSIA